MLFDSEYRPRTLAPKKFPIVEVIKNNATILVNFPVNIITLPLIMFCLDPLFTAKLQHEVLLLKVLMPQRLLSVSSIQICLK